MHRLDAIGAPSLSFIRNQGSLDVRVDAEEVLRTAVSLEYQRDTGFESSALQCRWRTDVTQTLESSGVRGAELHRTLVSPI